MTLLAYLEAMTDLEPLLPEADREALRRYQQSSEFRGDSRWPGWVRYLGPRPEARAKLRVVERIRRSA
jgi:hypothetical protein